METRNCGLFFGGLFLGGLLAGAAALFFAPKSGEELRSDVKHQGEKAFGEAKKLYSGAEIKAKSLFEDAKHAFTGAQERVFGSGHFEEEPLWEA
jgi:gas vesicle protein